MSKHSDGKKEARSDITVVHRYLAAYARQRLIGERLGGNNLEMQPSLDADVEMSAVI